MSIIINGDTGVSGVDGSATTPAFQGNDTNTGIFYPAADTIAFAEGGTEVMRINSSGNVGIGTTTINTRLQVNTGSVGPAASGNMNSGVVFQAGSGSQALNFGATVGSDYCWINSAFANSSNTATPLVFMTGATERMRIDSSGNVGIGTTTPAVKLDVESGIIRAGDIGSTGGSVAMYVNYSGTQYPNVIGTMYSSAATLLGFGVRSSTVAANAFLSTVDNVAWVRGALQISDNLIFSSAASQSTAIDSAVTMTDRFSINSSGYITNAVNGLSAGRMQAYQYYRLNSTVAGANATGAQSMFGVGVTLVGSTQYEFEGLYILSKSAGATSHNFLLGFGGTATVNNISYQVIGGFITSATPSGLLTIAAVSNGLGSVANSTAATQVTSAFTAVAISLVYRIKGTVSINAGGTFIPQYSLSAAPGGAYTTQIGSYFKISPLAASGANVNVGSWA